MSNPHMPGGTAREQVCSPTGVANVAHSHLLQEQAGPSSTARHEKDHREFRRKFSSVLETDVLDYQHCHASALERCVETLDKMFTNILEHPEEEKYRRVKDTSRVFQTAVASIPKADTLLLNAHWRPRVVDMQKSWVFEHPAASLQFRELGEAKQVLSRAQHMLHEKAERKRKEDEERKSKSAAERERIRLAIEEDRQQRQLQQELTAAHQPVHGAPSSHVADGSAE